MKFPVFSQLAGNLAFQHEISFLRANSLPILTGNFLRPCRELNRAIREVSAVIRESAFVRYLAFLLMTNLIARSRGSLISSSTPAFVRVTGAPGMRKSLAELVDANDRRSGLRDGGIGRVARRQLHQAPR